MLEYDNFKELICNELQRSLDREDFFVELKISDADNTINKKKDKLCSINTCFVLLVDEDVVREADMYKDNISQFFMDMDEPVLNTQVMMYSNKEKKLLFGDDVVIENSKSKKNVR